MASSLTVRRKKTDWTHICCTSLDHWHALHRAIHIGMCCRGEPLRSFLCSIDVRLQGSQNVSSYRTALIPMCCQHTMHGSRYLEHEFKHQCVTCKCTTSFLGQNDTEQGFLQNVAKSRKEKKKSQIVCVCTHCIPGYLYRVRKKTV